MKYPKYLLAAGHVLFFSSSGSTAQEEDAADPSIELVDAVRAGEVRDVTRLLGAGADAKTVTDGGMPLISVAAMKGHTAVADALVKAGADLAATDKVRSDRAHVRGTVQSQRHRSRAHRRRART